ncbi:MAG: M23 family metallopeptidase [Actinomycetota bacterium]
MTRRRFAALFAFAFALVFASNGDTAHAATPGYLRPVKGAIIRHFEPPPTPYSAGHRGIDMAVPVGTTVLASNDGIVTFAGPVAGELFVSIDHADGIRTTASYLSVILIKKGATVLRGQPIALSGTGHAGSTQPHLHFGARIGDTYIDPEPLLLDGLRRDPSQAIRLAPIEDEPAAAGGLPGRASIPAHERGGIHRRTRT